MANVNCSGMGEGQAGVFDRELHDRLLNEVLAADPSYKGWTLSNVMARREAEALLQSADEYF